MSNCRKNKNKGFTLVEMVAAFVILILICGLAIGSATAIQQTRLRHCTETIKSKYESTRELAKTHGVNMQLDITKVDGGFKLTVSGPNTLTEEVFVECGKSELFYKPVGVDDPYKLGEVDKSDVSGTLANTLTIVFAGSTGDIISRPICDYIILANGSKNNKLLLQQKGGMIYYDYESDLWTENKAPGMITVDIPYFTQDIADGRATMVATGSTVQPEFAYNAKYVKISGVYRAKDPSEDPYVIIFELKDPQSMQWADGTNGPVKLEWMIVEP